MGAAIKTQNACRKGGGGSLQTAATLYSVVSNVALVTNYSGTLRGMEESFNYLGQESTKK